MKLVFLAMAGSIVLSGCVDEKVEAKTNSKYALEMVTKFVLT